ncbi:MAG: S8 family serine peptidase [Chitinophagaceae bacterium]
MRREKPLVILCLFLTFIAACKKEKNNSGNSVSTDDCVTGNASGTAAIIEGQYIVMYKSASVNTRNMSRQSLESANENVLSRNSISAKSLEQSFAGESGGFVATLTADEATRLSKDETIEAIEPDRIISLSTCFTVVEPRLITWNINRVGYGDGTGKTAWIIDSGIDIDHPDLNVDVTRSKSFLTGQTSVDDENGHGTHVAGIIGAKNNTFGVLGVASGASLISLRVLDKDGEGTLSAIIQALAYVSQNGTAGDVVNMSVGDDEGVSTILDQQVKNTAAKGIYIAIAAGNDSKLANTSSPARANGTNIYTVSAIDSLDNFASFSNYGNDVVDYAVPGVRILSTYMGNRYAYMSGTSMAAPHMAGLLLLKGNKITTSGTAKNDPDGTPDPIAHY